VAAITSNSGNPLTALDPIQPRHTLLTVSCNAKAHSYCVIGGILINGKKRKCQLAIAPQQLHLQVMKQYHGGPFGGITQVIDCIMC